MTAVLPLAQPAAAPPEAGATGFTILPFALAGPGVVRRSPRYGIWWNLTGTGACRIDFRTHAVAPQTLLFLTPYQPFVFQPEPTDLAGHLIEFTPDFFCIERHRAEVGCSGILFNTLYDAPVLTLDAPGAAVLEPALEQMRAELARGGLAQDDALMALLKLFLIQATRLKLDQQPGGTATVPAITALATPAATAPAARRLPDLLERHFRTHKTAQDYADLVGLTAKALGRVVQRHFGRSVSELIQERVLMEAKRELFLTDAPVKAVAYGLGFDDPAHFSRYFRRGAGVSPEGYRQAVSGR